MSGLSAGFDADFGKFLSELDKVDVKLKTFGPEADRASAKLQRMADSLQGHKLVEQAGLAAAAIDKVGGAARLSEAELKRYGTVIDSAVSKLERMGSTVPASLKSAQAEIAALKAPIDTVNTGLGATDKLSSLAATGLTKMAAVAASAFAVERIATFARQVVDTGGDIADLSAKTGLTTTEVQRFQYVADQTGTSVDTVGRAVSQMSRRLVDGNKDAAKATRELGLSFSDLQAMSPGAAFERIAEAIRDVPDPMRQTSLAMDLFGKSGVDVLPAMKAGVKDLGDEFQNAGGVISGEAVAALDKFGDAWGRVSASFTGQAGQILGDVLRIKDGLGDLFSAVAPGGLGGGAGATSFGALGLFSKASSLLANKLDEFGFGVGPGRAPASALPSGDAFGVASERELNGHIASVDRQLAEAKAKQDKREQQEKAHTEKLTRLVEERQRKLDAITGRKVIADAQELVGLIQEIGATNIPRSKVDGYAQSLMAARKLAFETKEETIGLRKALDALPIVAAKSIGNLESLLNLNTIGFQSRDATSASRANTGSNAGFGSDITSLDNPFANRLVGLAPSITGTVVKATVANRDWAKSFSEVAQSFAQLSQISGGLEGATQAVGKFFGALDAGKSLAKGLGLDGKKGANAASGLAGAFLGFDLGQGFGRAGGALAGAAGGALAGAPYAAATGGASVAIGAVAGGVAGYFGARSAESELRKLKDLQAAQLVAQHGSLDALLTTAARLGLDQGTFLKRFYGEPREFAAAVNELTIALANEQRQADALGASMERVSKLQGILNRDQLQSLAGARTGSPVEDQARAFLEQQAASTVTGLDRFLSAGPLSPGAAAGAGEALGQAFEALVAQGVPANEAVRRLSASIEAYRKNAVEAGAGSTEAFDLLDLKLKALTDSTLGPFLERAFGAGQALAGLANQGRINQEIFSGLAPAIGEAFGTMERDGKGGVEAVRLLQGPLQNVWQLQKDFGFEVDESTQKVLDFAEANGLIGDKFRPAEDRMAAGIEKLVELIGRMATAFDGLPTSAGKAADGINAAWGRVKPLPVPSIEQPDVTRGANAASSATSSGERAGVYIDGEQVGHVVGRGIYGTAEFVS